MNTNINNNTNNNKNNSMYDVSSYSDSELYNILNLTNPTDRELEAKINSLIWKYTNMGNDSGQQLVDFFQDIYERFFESENDLETNEENDQITPSMILRSQQQQEDEQNEDEDQYEDEENIDETSDDTKQKYTSELTYSKGSLNPLLQQTTKLALFSAVFLKALLVVLDSPQLMEMSRFICCFRLMS